MLASLAIPLLLAAASPACALWPAPRSMTTGSKALWLEKDVEITYNGGPVCWRSTPDAPCHGESLTAETGFVAQLSLGDYKIKRAQLTSERVVTNGVTRALDSIFKRNIVPWKLRPRGELAKHEPDVETAKQYVNSLRINVNGTDGPEAFKPLAGEVDESYRLTLSENGTATLTAVSSIGVLRGLETFVQLFYTHSSKRGVYTPYAPVVIADSPKYPHRGVLLDVARNWYPVDTIMRTIDAIAANKMNRLHLHVTDSQSWPLVIPSMPTLAEKGAYAEGLWYDAEDMDAIQTHGAMLGVEVIVEIDMPGHIGSLYHSHPELVVAYNAKPYDKWCAEPPCGAFRFNSSSVDRFLAALFDDLLPRLKPFSAYFHTGGDELNVNDSLLDDDIKSNSTAVLKPKIQAFIDRNHQRVREHGMTPMVWEEIPLQWNVSMGKDVVVQSWLGGSSMQRLTSMGYKVIESSSDFWVGRAVTPRFLYHQTQQQLYDNCQTNPPPTVPRLRPRPVDQLGQRAGLQRGIPVQRLVRPRQVVAAHLQPRPGRGPVGPAGEARPRRRGGGVVRDHRRHQPGRAGVAARLGRRRGPVVRPHRPSHGPEQVAVRRRPEAGRVEGADAGQGHRRRPDHNHLVLPGRRRVRVLRAGVVMSAGCAGRKARDFWKMRVVAVEVVDGMAKHARSIINSRSQAWKSMGFKPYHCGLGEASVY